MKEAGSWRVVPMPDADVRYLPRFLAPGAAERLFRQLRSDIPWRQPRVRIAGREIDSPRLAAWFGDPGAVYRYSGTINEPLPWLPALDALRRDVEAECRSSFNSVLANLYRDGDDSMGWHSDAEPELGDQPVIASVSLGSARRFLLRHRRRKEIAGLRLSLEPGSLLLMRGQTQHCWRHSVPKTRQSCGPRINLTFRYVGSCGNRS